jgi:hypothetical protein
MTRRAYFPMQDTTPGQLDYYLGEGIMLPDERGTHTSYCYGKGKGCDYYIGRTDEYPLLDAQQYAPTFLDGNIEAWNAITIPENLFDQSD